MVSKAHKMGFILPAEWKDSKAIKVWQKGVRESTFETYGSWLRSFLKYAGKGPDEFLAWAKQQSDKYQILEAIQPWVRTYEKRRYGTSLGAYVAIRSFLMYNRVELPKDRTFHIHATTPRVERKITVPNLLEIIHLSPQPWRSMLLTKWQGILDTEGIVYTSNHSASDLVKAIRENKDICKITIPGRKKTRNISSFYTFIGSDALASLRDYFDRERGYPKPDEPVWVYRQTGRPVTIHGLETYWLRILRKAQLIPSKSTNDPGTRYGFNIHNTRDLAITLLKSKGIREAAVEFWAGHLRKIDPLGYTDYTMTPDFLEEQYHLAIPHLNILSGARDPEITEDKMIDRLIANPRIEEIIMGIVDRLYEEKYGKRS